MKPSKLAIGLLTGALALGAAIPVQAATAPSSCGSVVRINSGCAAPLTPTAANDCATVSLKGWRLPSSLSALCQPTQEAALNCGALPAQSCSPAALPSSPRNLRPSQSCNIAPSQPAGVSSVQRPADSTSVPPASNPSSVPSATELSADEQEMLNLVNKERAAAGVQPLQIDLRLVAAARAKAADMKTNNYFDHTSPTYGSPWALMQSFGLTVQWAGENIGGNQTVAAAMAAWMQSSGHRENILDPRFTHLGVGVAYGSSYGNLYVQEFLQE
ncbi:MAG: CAP domain-containing protein [Peptococcaceae bacterium]|nr:CAP domain-containing protein [Peptococcaceae bacterium]